MKNQPVCGNDETRPVTLWENESVHGKALCHESCVDEHFAAVKALRDRQAAYLQGLPTDPNEAIKAAWDILNPDRDTILKDVEQSQHLAVALEALLDGDGIQERARDQEAAKFIANMITSSLVRTINDIEHLTYVLENPSRVERLKHVSC